MLNTCYALMVRNADEKGRAKIDMELEQAAIRAELAMHGGHDPRRRHRQPAQPGTPAPDGSNVIHTGRFTKVAPPGFDPETIRKDSENVKKFLAAQPRGGA
jgi:hypothetical protein